MYNDLHDICIILNNISQLDQQSSKPSIMYYREDDTWIDKFSKMKFCLNTWSEEKNENAVLTNTEDWASTFRAY